MLFLLSIALVIGALVLLVLGLLVDKGLGLIYTSIAASVVAAIVLIVSVRLDRDRPAAVVEGPSSLPEASGGDEPPVPTATHEPVTAFQAEPAPAPPALPEPPAPVEAQGDDQWAPQEPAATAAPAAEEWAATGSGDGAWADDEFFPIADYDELTVQEILPLLPQLYPEEIPVVEQRERATKSRAVILDTLADLRSEVPAAPAAAPLAEESWAPPAEEEPVAEPAPQVPEEAYEDLPFPIEDYDELSAPAIVGVLDQLEPDELAEVRAHEAAHASRGVVLDAIDRLQPGAETAPVSASPVTPVDPAEEVAARKPAAKKTAAKKATAKKTTAKKAPARKTAEKKSAAKKAPAKKAPAKAAGSAGARKASTGKAPARKTVAEQAAVKKPAAEKAAAKKAVAKKTVAKKAASTKKAPTRAPAGKAAGKKTPSPRATKKS